MSKFHLPAEAADEGEGAAAAGFETADDGEALPAAAAPGAGVGAVAPVAVVDAADGLPDLPGAATFVGAVVAVDPCGAGLG